MPTPPDSNKPANYHEDGEECSKTGMTKLKGGGGGHSGGGGGAAADTKTDRTGNLPNDQLAKMFPTPPSHEGITSPAASDPNAMDVDGHHHHPPSSVKSEQQLQPASLNMDHMDLTGCDDSSIWAAPSIFSPLGRLYSDDFAPIVITSEIKYVPRLRRARQAVK